MSHTLTVRLDPDLADWLQREAKKTGAPQGKIVRDQLARARARSGTRSFMRLAGVVRLDKDLSTRKGFTRS